MLMQAPATGYSAGCVVRKKLVYLEELRRRGPDFGEYLQILQTWSATLRTHDKSLLVPPWSPMVT